MIRCLLADNPLQKISNTRNIEGVVLNGQWLDRDGLDEVLASVAEHSRAIDESNAVIWSATEL